MNKKIVLLFVVFVCVLLSAQNVEDKKYLLTTKTSTFELTLPNIIDPYLSPLPYSGIGFSYNTAGRRFISANNTNYSMQNKFSISTGLLLNPAYTSEMLYAGANYGWGINYHFRISKQLRILGGCLLDADLGFKNVPRNINNPVNLDMATNMNLTGLLLYDLHVRRKMLHFEVAMQAPIIGCMFVPYGGASYYDMFELGGLTNAFHFSSIHNKRGLDQTYSIKVPFNSTTWRFGLRLQNLKYKANDMVFKHNELSLIVGTTFDAISFSGKKKVAPANFISTNN